MRAEMIPPQPQRPPLALVFETEAEQKLAVRMLDWMSKNGAWSADCSKIFDQWAAAAATTSHFSRTASVSNENIASILAHQP